MEEAVDDWYVLEVSGTEKIDQYFLGAADKVPGGELEQSID